MKRRVLFAILFAFVVLVASDVSAQRKVRVRFPRGKSAVILRGTLSRYQARDYIVRASSGQALTSG